MTVVTTVLLASVPPVTQNTSPAPGREYRPPSTSISAFINSQAAVAAPPSKAKPDIQMLLPHQILKGFDMRRATVLIDVQSVGSIMNHIGLSAQSVKYAFGNHPYTAVSAVQPDPHALIGAGCQGDQVADVAVAAGRIVGRGADLVAKRQGISGRSPSR